MAGGRQPPPRSRGTAVITATSLLSLMVRSPLRRVLDVCLRHGEDWAQLWVSAVALADRQWQASRRALLSRSRKQGLMGFRFRKCTRLFPSVNLNWSKHRVSSISIGGPGASINVPIALLGLRLRELHQASKPNHFFRGLYKRKCVALGKSQVISKSWQ